MAVSGRFELIFPDPGECPNGCSCAAAENPPLARCLFLWLRNGSMALHRQSRRQAAAGCPVDQSCRPSVDPRSLTRGPPCRPCPSLLPLQKAVTDTVWILRNASSVIILHLLSMKPQHVAPHKWRFLAGCSARPWPSEPHRDDPEWREDPKFKAVPRIIRYFKKVLLNIRECRPLAA